MAELDPGWQHDESPFHSVSRQIQARLGMGDKMAQIGQRTIRGFLPQQHRDFYPQLPFLLVGSVDGAGQPWASIVCGQPGFLTTPTSEQLSISARPLAGDLLMENLHLNAPLGVLGIELPTRRRNRLNGKVSVLDEHGFAIAVDQAFGNCPKYIQSREPTFIAPADLHPGLPVLADQLDAKSRAIITSADTLFIATSCLIAPESERRWQGVDISHRGGKPGFVAINDDGSLTLPDYLGNFHFRTLGNIQLEPRAGLLFVDFETGDILQVAVRGSIIWDGPRLDSFAGAQRLVDLQVTQTRLLPGALPLRFTPPQYSPVLPV
ncbi:pyridoxamine 5'-phosphate oxidase family protein [Silvimonas soli]|uniref:pyridoxamine 5'-phosphate oxidase family protein n=1 Tax=Silvimonas soli TaxID=2980100 RepID=UPI0024B33F6D|nr:pyridoxamine 5'-phosphate oxidase family protein [Silvimonas soli]